MTDTNQNADDSTDATSNIAERRSEFTFLFDAVDANPNGNPMDPENRPRIDRDTGQCIVTDVRLKRYIRSQMRLEGHPVYIADVKPDGEAPSRAWLITQRIDSQDPDSITDDVTKEFLRNAKDARMFGATFSVSENNDKVEHAEKLKDALTDHVTGPVQIQPATTLHPVEMNNNSNSLTSVISTGDGNEQGGFDLSDHRIKFGLFSTGGVVDPQRAADALLTERDVQDFDNLLWRAVEQQTTSRNKMGQSPQFYLRAEYTSGVGYIGNFGSEITVDEERTGNMSEVRRTQDVVVDFTAFIDRLQNYESRIDTLHVAANDLLNVSFEGELVKGREDAIYNLLRQELSTVTVNVLTPSEMRDVTDTSAATASGDD